MDRDYDMRRSTRYRRNDETRNAGARYGDRATRESGWEPARVRFDDERSMREYRDDDDRFPNVSRDRTDWSYDRDREFEDRYGGRQLTGYDTGYSDVSRWRGDRDWERERGRMQQQPRRFTSGYGSESDWVGSYDQPRGDDRYRRQTDYEYGSDQDRFGFRGRGYGERSVMSRQFDWDTPERGYRGTQSSTTWRATDYESGPYSGRGPRTYQRSDDRICEDVCERLTRHGELDASDVDVQVNSGEVTLRGMVNTRWDKRSVEDIADEVYGVREVHNQLRVRDRTTGTWDDRSRYGGYGYSEQEQDWERRQRDDRITGMGPAGAGVRTSGMETTTGRSTTQGTAGRGRVEVGMDVVGSDATVVGQVKEVRASDFLVDRTMQRDIYVPYSAVANVGGYQVMLNVTASEVDNMGWENPAVMGGDEANESTTTTP